MFVFNSKCIHLLSCFDHRNHVCLVSELRTISKENDFAPFPRHHIQSFAKQFLGSVACKFLIGSQWVTPLPINGFAVLHELRLIHTDLKPENILLVKNDYRIVEIPLHGKVRSFH